MKILWLDINSSYSHSSLAIPALDAQLSEETRGKHSWKIVRGTIKSDTDTLIGEICSYAPELILSTLWLFNHEYVMTVLKKSARLLPEAKIMIGGPEFLSDNRHFLESNPEITAVFKGEGEEIFEEFISEPENYKKIEGFCYLEDKGKDGIHYKDRKAVRTLHFDRLRPPEESGRFEWGKSFIQIETSRGCFNSCRFCISGRDNEICSIPVECLRKRFDRAVAEGIKNIRILDRTFNADAGRAKELIELFREYAGKIRFHVEVHPAFISDPFAAYLETVPKNLLHIETGLQSLDEKVLSCCGRKGGAARSLAGIRKLMKTEFGDIHTDLIAGLPGYGLQALASDVVTLAGIKVSEIQLELLKLLPGTPLREKSDEYGIRWSPLPPYEVLATESMSFEDLHIAKILSRAIDYWYNDRSWREVFTASVCTGADALLDFAGSLDGGDFLSSPYSMEKKGTVLSAYIEKHYPELDTLMSAAWLRNGLSVKKGPGLRAVPWKGEETCGKNPLLEDGGRESRYYYIEENGYIRWFRYERGESGRGLAGYARTARTDTCGKSSKN